MMLLILSASIKSQTIFEPVYNRGIYDYLNILSSKGIISFFDDIRPVTRLDIAKKLITLKKFSSELTQVERDELNFYASEYAFELKYLTHDTTAFSEFFKSGITDRFHLFKYYDENFTFDADPVLGLSYDISKKNYHQYSGLKLKGRLGKSLGYYFDYRDNLEKGDNLDVNKSFTPGTGIIISKGGDKKIEYSETRGGLTYSWDWGSLTAAKDFINIGSSYQSQVILSSKAPVSHLSGLKYILRSGSSIILFIPG